LTNLTHNPATDDNFRWSPDGQHIAFSSDRDGNKEIYLLDVQATLQGQEDSGLIRLTDNPTVDVPSGWSPDGTRLLFLSERDGNLDVYVMAVDPLTGAGGSGETRLTTDPALDLYPAWSPAGQWIAFVSMRDGNHEVYVMAPDGSGQRNLTASPATDAQFWWSPDGRQIAVSSMLGGAWSTWIVDVEGAGRKQLDVVGCLDWRPPYGQ
jgi:Tol biopolymer transport system component